MSNPDTWMPLYIGDYLRDTGHLSTVEHGAYFLLIMQAWSNGGAVPADEERLRIITKMDRSEWRRSKGTLLAFFVPDGPRLRHARVERELKRAQSISERRSTAGRIGAAKRWQCQDGAAGMAMPSQTDGNRIAVASESHRQTDGPSHSPVEGRKKASVLRTDAVPASSQPELLYEPDDPRDALWKRGPGAVKALTGLPEKRARGVVGQLVKAAGDDCAKVLACLAEAERLRPVDPLAWLVKAAAFKPPDAPNHHDPSNYDWAPVAGAL